MNDITALEHGCIMFLLSYHKIGLWKSDKNVINFFRCGFLCNTISTDSQIDYKKKVFLPRFMRWFGSLFLVMVSIAQHNSVRISPLKHNLLYPANYLAFTDRMSPCAGKTIPFYLSLYMEIERSVNALFRLRALVETIYIDGNKVWFGFLSCWGINSQNQLEKMQRGN